MKKWLRNFFFWLWYGMTEDDMDRAINKFYGKKDRKEDNH